MSELLERKGYNKLWDWFGLSYASWLTLPRVMMHEMPDEWQERMAELLHEWDETWDSNEMPEPHVAARKGNRYTKWPGWLLNYRHPDAKEIERLRSNAARERRAEAARSADVVSPTRRACWAYS